MTQENAMDLMELMEECGHKLTQIKSRINSQIDRSGTTLQTLKEFWYYMEIDLLLEKDGA